MQLTPPRQWTFYLALALWIIAFVAIWVPLPDAPLEGLTTGYILALISGLVLILGNALKSM
jgi:hypothetical protein